MTTPIQIADAKISLACSSATEELRAEAEAIHRRAAAKRMLKSGNTIVEVKDQCVSTIQHLGEVASQELQWALSHTFFASPVDVNRCNAVAHRYIDAIGSECSAVLLNTVGLCGDRQHFEITEPDLRTQEQQSRMTVSLALDTKYSEMKYQRMRAVFGFLQRLIQIVVRS